MKKYSLQKVGILGIASTLIIMTSACNQKNVSALPVESEMVKEEIIEISSNEEPVIDDESLKREFVYDAEAPIALPIEVLEMEDGKLGYKMPMFYHAYLVDEEKPLPGMAPVLELTEDYIIEGGGYATSSDGSVSYRGFEGAVAVYHPYYLGLRLKNENEEEFQKMLEEIKNTYGTNSSQYQILSSVALGEVEEAVEQVYYDTNKKITK